tara:strand:- start:369 stop:1856 length:1488 start_codon:yes stop_codon:yes gene_type:complete
MSSDWGLLADHGTSLPLTAVFDDLENGKGVCKQLADFWGKVAEIEKTYAQSLHSLVNSPLATMNASTGSSTPAAVSSFFSFIEKDVKETKREESPEIKNSWENVKQQLLLVANAHKGESMKINTHVIQPLRNYIDSSFAGQKEKFADASRGVQYIAETKQAGEKASERLVKLNSELGRAKSSSSAQAQQKAQHIQSEIQKTEAIVKRSKETCSRLEDEFKKQTLPKVLSIIQRLEQERVTTFVLSVANYVKVKGDTLRVDISSNDTINSVANDVNRGKALMEFLVRTFGKNLASELSRKSGDSDLQSGTAGVKLASLEEKRLGKEFMNDVVESKKAKRKPNDRDQVLGFVQKMMSAPAAPKATSAEKSSEEPAAITKAATEKEMVTAVQEDKPVEEVIQKSQEVMKKPQEVAEKVELEEENRKDEADDSKSSGEDFSTTNFSHTDLAEELLNDISSSMLNDEAVGDDDKVESNAGEVNEKLRISLYFLFYSDCFY